MLKQLISILIILISYSTYAQNLSGIVNKYQKVVEINNCTFIRVQNATDFIGVERIILMQMQGASIQTGDSGSYGNVTNLNGTGQWEILNINSINGDTLFLEFSVLKTYDINKSVQIISFPEYEDVVIDSELFALAWDGEIGGVLAFESSSITLQADINVSGLGFRGGQDIENTDNNCNGLIGENDYIYDGNDWRGARKGESVWKNITPFVAGRGAPANGGGGGNDHNSGGGGGAMITSGGHGGENREPSFFGCHGYFPGVGGHGLDYNLQRLFLGGGGGAGHGNNNNATNGGNGGGIIIIKTNQVTSNGYYLKANGINALSTAGDGAGGGGSGGSIYLDVLNVSSNLYVEALGGNGGNIENNNQDRCHGPGGGGSGGFTISTEPYSVVNMDGGNKGLSMNSSDGDCTESNVGSVAGQGGFQIALYEWTQNDQDPSNIQAQIAMTQMSICPILNYTVPVIVAGVVNNYQWQYFDGNTWIDLVGNTNFSGVQTSELNISTLPADAGVDLLRCVITNDCGFEAISNELSLVFDAPLVNDYSFDISNHFVTFTNLSPFGLSYFWDFGDDTSSSAYSTSHLYEDPGSYEVTLTVTNGCEILTYTQTVLIEDVLQIVWNSEYPCAPASVQFSTPSTGVDYQWTFEGGSPPNSTDTNPSVDYLNAGLFDVSLTIDGVVQALQDTVAIYQTPYPGFTFVNNNNTFTFTNTSTGATSYVWEFGDGFNSTDENPIHTYNSLGTFTVTLQAFSGPCSIISSQEIVPVHDVFKEKYEINIYPNPVNDILFLEVNNPSILSYEMYDVKGRLLQSDSLIHKQTKIDFNGLSHGVYILKIRNKKGGSTFFKVVK